MAATLEERLNLIASKMTLREPFIASLFTRLPRRVVDNKSVTAATNGEEYIFGREFCDPLSDEQLLGLAIHEAMHVALMHMWRRGDRDPNVWNVANDAIINHMIGRMDGVKLPDGGVSIGWVNDSMDSETVYNKLLQDMPPEGGDGEGDDDGEGDGSDGEGEGDGKSDGTEGLGKGDRKHKRFGAGGFNGKGDLLDAPSEAGRVDVEATIIAAAKMAKACGDDSMLVNRILGGELTPSVDWRDVVRMTLTSSARDDYTYGRINKRFISQGVYLPSLWNEAMGGLVIGFDTSGSMGQAELDRVAAEIRGIVEDCNPDWVEVVYCDAAIAGTQRFERGEPLELRAKGGGGTRFKPVFDYIEKKDERIAGMIYLTDLQGPTDELREPEYPVIWGTTYAPGNTKGPFGQTVRVTV